MQFAYWISKQLSVPFFPYVPDDPFIIRYIGSFLELVYKNASSDIVQCVNSLNEDNKKLLS